MCLNRIHNFSQQLVDSSMNYLFIIIFNLKFKYYIEGWRRILSILPFNWLKYFLISVLTNYILSVYFCSAFNIIYFFLSASFLTSLTQDTKLAKGCKEKYWTALLREFEGWAVVQNSPYILHYKRVIKFTVGFRYLASQLMELMLFARYARISWTIG